MVVNMVAICLEKLGHSNFESPVPSGEVQILGFNPARERSGREEGEVRAGHAFHSTSLQEVPIHYNGAYFRIDMHRIMPCPQGSVPVLSWFDAVFCILVLWKGTLVVKDQLESLRWCLKWWVKSGS